MSVTNILADTFLAKKKTSFKDFALLGGTPAFMEALHVGRPNIGDRDKLTQRFNEMLDRKWFTNNGPLVQEFEEMVAAYLGVRHCIAMCNGTVALEIAARALDLTGEVIVPSNSFVATAHCLQWQEITPVFCDVDPVTHNIDPEQIERLITPRTTGILCVHVWGNPGPMEALEEIAAKHGLKLMFDASHAFGAEYKGRMIGNFGQAETFSFHATKFVNCFEGGAVTTNNDELAEKMRLMRNFGFAGEDSVIYIGVNGKMSEISAAMGITSLESIDHFITINERNYDIYAKYLGEIPGIRVFPHSKDEKRNFQYVIIEIDEAVTGIGRDDLYRLLVAENVLARRYFYPGIHQMEPYRSFYPNAGLLLPETESLCLRVLAMPTGTAVGEEEVAAICHLIKFAIEQADSIVSRLRSDG